MDQSKQLDRINILNTYSEKTKGYSFIMEEIKKKLALKKTRDRASEIRRGWLERSKDSKLELELDRIKRLTMSINENDSELRNVDEEEFEHTYWQVRGLVERDKVKIEAYSALGMTLAVFFATLGLFYTAYTAMSSSPESGTEGLVICGVVLIVAILFVFGSFLLGMCRTKERSYWRIRAMMMEEIRNNK